MAEHPRSNSPILKTTTPCFGGEPTCNHCNCTQTIFSVYFSIF
jgi:hypothetical protein